MSKCHSLWALVVLLLACNAGRAQDNSAPPQASAPADANPQQPAPAYGPDNAVPSVSENPPISGLDVPNLEPHAAPLSYLQAGAHLSQQVDSNVQNSLGGSKTSTISNALGSLDLRRLWSNYDLSLNYVGGVGYYNASGIGFRQIEELGVYQKITWKRGEFGVRDAFSYQPEGTFGGSYGSVVTSSSALSGQGTFFGGTGLGALGQVPRIMNLSLVNVVENLTPKSSVTVTGGYGFVHFLENEPSTGAAFIGNGQTSAQVGYDRLLGPHDQGALVYGYQRFTFSTGTSFQSNVIQVMWGHRISGRMDFLIGAGPQFTQIDNALTFVSNPTSADTIPPCIPAPTTNDPIGENCPRNDFRISAAGRASLRYKFPRASLSFFYSHYLTSGSGFFAGAESDVAQLTLTRPLGRIWTAFTDLGFSRNSRVTAASTTQAGTIASRYEYGFAGVGIRRYFGRTLNAYASYQFNDLSFDSSFCGTAVSCNRISQRHVGTIGLDWTPRPIRLD